MLSTWRGHTDSVTSIEVVDDKQLVATSSEDCCVRLWTWKGAFIGTFGQPTQWDLSEGITYQSPMRPFDVLIDPLTATSAAIQDMIKDVDIWSFIQKPQKKQVHAMQHDVNRELFGDTFVSNCLILYTKDKTSLMGNLLNMLRLYKILQV